MDWNDLRVSSTVHLSNNSVINLFKLSREFPRDLHHKLVDKHLHNHLDGKIWDKLSDEHWDKLDGKSLDYGRIFESEFLNSAFVNFHKDLQLWDRDKLTVIDIITKRLRTSLHSTQSNLPPNTSAPGPNNYRDPRSLPDPRNDMNGRTVPHVRSGDEELVMDLESELLISWLDRYVSDISNISSGSKIFMENAVKLLKKVDLAPVNLLNFMFSLVKLAAAKPQNFFHKYLKLSLAQLEKQAFSNLHYYILNTRQLFLNDLILNTELTPAETLKLVFQTANTFYASDGGINGFNTGKLPDYYFFILYLLFRSGSHSSISLLLTYLEKNSGISGTRDIEGFSMSLHEVPPLFTDLCRVLLNILLEKCDNTDLLPQFLSKYPQSGATRVDNTNPLVNYGTGVNPMTVNTVNIWLEMLLSIVFPDNYVECDVSVLTREDYIWYKLRLMLNSGSLVVRSYELCKSLTQESINATDKDLFDRIVSYAYCMALSGGVMESLRLLMSAVKVPQVQSIAMVFTVLGENCGLFDFEEVNFVSYALWNFVDQNNKLVKSHNTEELSYLLLLAFNRNRNVSTELKVLLSTLLPVSKSMLGVKYCVSENFNDAVSPAYLGSSVTKDGMLLVGPLLQKLIKLSSRRNAAKYAILLLAQYCAYVGLHAAAFKCFYCIQDTDNCAAVLEACCCYLYDKDDGKKTFSIDDLLVYYTLTKNLSPGNKHVLELRRTFSCIELCVLVKNNKYFEAVSYCKKHKVFDNSLLILRNESHQIYFNALFSYIKALKLLIATGSQPLELVNVGDASNLLDLLEAAYQNPNTDRKLTIEALHTLLTFISINPTK